MEYEVKSIRGKINQAENLIGLNMNDEMAHKTMLIAQRNQMYSPVNYMCHP